MKKKKPSINLYRNHQYKRKLDMLKEILKQYPANETFPRTPSEDIHKLKDLYLRLRRKIISYLHNDCLEKGRLLSKELEIDPWW